MKHLNKLFAVKLTALVLALLLVHGSVMIFPQEDRLEKLFQWAKMDYNAGKYRDVATDLELMLSYYDKGTTDDSGTGGKKLKGKIHLLLGATYEKLGRIKDARENYQLAKSLLEERDSEIEDVILSELLEYRRIVMQQQAPDATGPNIIERPRVNPHKKKRRLLQILIGGLLVAGTVTAVLLLQKKGTADIEVDENYDTRQMGIEWTYVFPNEYLMGDNFNEGDADEQPVHTVFLSGYYISRHEITFAQFDKFIADSNRTGVRPSDNGWGRGSRPVINVTWKDANDFCVWLSKKTGKNIHLPTEAQWEIAARGIDQPRFPWGNTPPDCNKANYNCAGQTHPVGIHPEGVSPVGALDMAGNVSEWCGDAYSADFYQNSQYTDPFNKPPDVSHQWNQYVIRGGSWTDEDTSTIRCADRSFGKHYHAAIGYQPNDTTNNHLGFRIASD